VRVLFSRALHLSHRWQRNFTRSGSIGLSGDLLPSCKAKQCQQHIFHLNC
jgi:hypothetical protein